ncbi:MAG: prepilin-type N-terminal cleavage/methylation domain-containing protein [Pseudomonadota bacterium]
MLVKSYRKVRRGGFSLIEVLVAVIVVGVGFLAAASMQGTSVGGNSRSALLTTATYLAEDKIEELRNRAYIAIDAIGSPENQIDGLGHAGGLFSRSWTVLNDTPGRLMKTISVTVTWQERGAGHRLVMTTIVGG